MVRNAAKVDVAGEDLEQPSVAITEPKPSRGRGLRIQVDEQDAVALLSQGRGEVDRIVVLPLPPFWLLTAMVRKIYLKTLSLEAHVTRVAGECQPGTCRTCQ